MNDRNLASRFSENPTSDDLCYLYDAAAVPVTIGSDFRSNESSTLFTGRIDEVALYLRALTTDELAGIRSWAHPMSFSLSEGLLPPGTTLSPAGAG